MTNTIIVLTETGLSAFDVTNIVELHEGQEYRYEVLVPADTERNLVVDFIDSLSMGELREAWDAMLGREPNADHARQEAAAALTQSIEAFKAADREATGSIVADDPLPPLVQAVANHEAAEVVIVTFPHALEDTFHQDWASKAREQLGVPVLHLYAGTDELG